MDKNKFVLKFEDEELSIDTSDLDCALYRAEKKITINDKPEVGHPFDDPLEQIKKYNGRKAGVIYDGHLYKDILVVVN